MNNFDAVSKADYLLELLVKNQPSLFSAPKATEFDGKNLGDALCALRQALIDGLKKQD